MRGLKSLGIEAASYGALLLPVLLTKLPPDLWLIVSRKVSSSNLDMDALLTTFEEELTARERANPQLPQRIQEKSQHTASTLLSGSQDSKANPLCSYCQQSHPSTSCTSVTDLIECKLILKTSGRCFNCLHRSHIARHCKSLSRCQKCKKKHHTSICDAGQNQQPSLPRPTSGAGMNADASPFKSTWTTSTFCSNNVQSVFLQTACATIYHPCNPQVSLEVHLILDGGSQKSYISERARDLLDLEATEEQSLSIATFGSNKGSMKVCPIVNFGMCLKGHSFMSLSLYVIPTICEPLVGQPITACVKQYPHLLGLELADSSSPESSMPVDLLIGDYWQLVTGNIQRGAPIAVHTKLGWVLSGPFSHDEPGQCAMNLSVTHVLHSESHSIEPCSLNDQLQAFWELESLGIQDEEKTLYDEFAGTVKFENGRYKVPLPWREFHDPLPDNYSMSLSRLQGLLH